MSTVFMRQCVGCVLGARCLIEKITWSDMSDYSGCPPASTSGGTCSLHEVARASRTSDLSKGLSFLDLRSWTFVLGPSFLVLRASSAVHCLLVVRGQALQERRTSGRRDGQRP